MTHSFHGNCCITTVRCTHAELYWKPTAQSVPLGVAAMLFRSLCEAPRLGLPTMLHAEPFQSSVSVRSLLNVFWKKLPAAHTASVDIATALRRSANPVASIGRL